MGRKTIFLFLGIASLFIPPCSAQSPEETFRRLSGLTVGALELRPLRVSSVAVDSSDQRGDSVAYFVRLIIDGELTLHSRPDRSGVPLLKGKFNGSLVGRVFTEKAHREAITAIELVRRGLDLQVTTSAAVPAQALGPDAGFAGRFYLRNPEVASFSEQATQGHLSLNAISTKVQGATLELKPDDGGVVPLRLTVTEQPKGMIDLNAGTINWNSGRLSITPATVPLKLRGNTIEVNSEKVTFSSGEVKLSTEGTNLKLGKVTFESPTVRLLTGSLPVDAVARANIASLATKIEPGAPIVFPLTPPMLLRFEPEPVKLVDLLNDYNRVPNQYVPTGDTSVPFISTYALRNFHSAVTQAVADEKHHHNIVAVVNELGAIDEVHYAKQEGASSYICVSLAWAAKVATVAAFDAPLIVATARQLLTLGFAAGLTAGAILTPAVTPWVMAAVIGVGAVAEVAALEYWSDKLEEVTGLPGAPMFGKDILKSLIEKGVKEGCDLALGRKTQDSRLPTNQASIAKLPERKDGESLNELSQRRAATLAQSGRNWPRLSTTEQRAIQARQACCDPRPAQEALKRNNQIWIEYAASKSQALREHQEQINKQRAEQWANQQRENQRASRIEERTAQMLQEQARESMRAALGGGSTPVIEIQFGGGGVGGPSIGGAPGMVGGNCGACACSLTCLEYKIPR